VTREEVATIMAMLAEVLEQVRGLRTPIASVDARLARIERLLARLEGPGTGSGAGIFESDATRLQKWPCGGRIH